MTLLSRLESKRSERRKRAKSNNQLNGNKDYIYSEYNENEITEDRRKMYELVKESSVLDSSGEYHIINFLQRSQSLGFRNHIRQDLSLISQSSVSQLYNLDLLAHRWHGLISVSVFALSQDIPLAIEAILLLRRCHPSIRQNTSFHLVYPLSVPMPPIGATTMAPRPSIDIISNERNCHNIESVLQSMQSNLINYAHNGVSYPNNLLRNVARRNSLTEFIFVIDIDLVPSDNLYEDFTEFAKENKLYSESQREDKVVYVVPAYEIKIDSNSRSTQQSLNDLIPHDKRALLELIELMEARPFYIELCWKCQKYTDYETWQRQPIASKFSVLFEVLWRDPWEPFYISRNTVPLYDERFRQYGFNRISQVLPLFIFYTIFFMALNKFISNKKFTISIV
jgi:N-acetyllactosaminide beta-1,3-N-acetylglucosaminyltransferase